MWNHLVRKSHHPDPCPFVPLIPAFREPPSSLPEAPKPVAIQNLLGRNEITVFSIGIIQTITLTFSAKFGTVVQVSLPPTPCQQCWNYFEIPSGRNHHHKYLKFQFIKRQRKKSTQKHSTWDLANLWAMELSRKAFLNTPKTLAGSTSLSPQEYSNSSARTSVRKEKNKVTLTALS